jgi:hypothetical protein
VEVRVASPAARPASKTGSVVTLDVTEVDSLWVLHRDPRPHPRLIELGSHDRPSGGTVQRATSLPLCGMLSSPLSTRDDVND